MIRFVEMKFCSLPPTPLKFNEERFLARDDKQIQLYKDSKKPNRDEILSYEEIKTSNYARVLPKGCMFIDFDNSHEFKRMKEIVIHSKLKCLILETQNGGHFLFRTPNFYEKEMTKATNWFGYKFDCKATTDTTSAVQIMRVCGMKRKEVHSLALDTLITPEKLDIETLDVLPYWLWGKLKNIDLHKGGKPGESEYTLTDTPFTQLMTMSDGGRHNQIFSRCGFFAVANGFKIDEFKSLIQIIHDKYLTKIGTPMPDSDLFGDLEERWDSYEETMNNSSWFFEEKERKWKKSKSKKEQKIDERRAAEYLFKEYDFYGCNRKPDGTFSYLLFKEIGDSYKYNRDITVFREKLKEHSDQNFKDGFFKEVEVQIMQMCATKNKVITRNDKYIIVKNKVLSCISPDAYDFSWLGTRPPTDVVFNWNWYSEDWVKEHEKDLGANITWFIKQLARNSRGVNQPEVEQWLWVIAGAAMVPANQLEKIVILSGGGQNGKSLYTSLIKLCLGEDMFNESKIFGNTPIDNFWGKDLDKGICCIVDDLPKTYNRNALTNIKGALTGTDSVEINEKFKPKKELYTLPQIIACTNFEFELYDKSEGMKRRVQILPTECHIDDTIKDTDLQHKLVLNVTDRKSVVEYKLSESAYGNYGKKVMNMYTGEKGVLDSLKDGSLAWFANKARYMYFKWLNGEITLEDNEEMKTLHNITFKNDLESECENFINWYVDSKCGTDNNRDLLKANTHFNKLYPVYEYYCELEGINKMKLGQFNKFCSKAISNLQYQIEDRKMKKENGKSEAYRYVIFGKEVPSSKK